MCTLHEEANAKARVSILSKKWCVGGHRAVEMSTKTKKIGAAAWALPRANLKFCSRAPREGVFPQLS